MLDLLIGFLECPSTRTTAKYERMKFSKFKWLDWDSFQHARTVTEKKWRNHLNQSYQLKRANRKR